MGCSNSKLEAKVNAIDAKVSELLARSASNAAGPEAALRKHKSSSHGTRKLQTSRVEEVDGSTLGPQHHRQDGRYDIFVSHAKRLAESEDRAVWVADVVEAQGLVPFFDRSDLVEITESAIEEALLSSDVLVTVLDPFTFHSKWVFKENLVAANAGIPIVPIYDADRFRWDGQLDKLCRLYPWVFKRQVVPLTKSQRRTSTDALLNAIEEAANTGRNPPPEPIDAAMNERVKVLVGVGGSRETDTHEAIDTAHKTMLTRLEGRQPSLVVCAFTCMHDAEEVAKRVHELSPTVPMIGCTSCRGLVMNDTWLTHNKEFALGLWGLCDDAGTYITLHLTERGPSLRDEVFAAVTKAMEARIRAPGEEPSFAMLLGSPGDEETILDGMRAALGDSVPILGGSSADNTVSGAWRQIATPGHSSFGVGAPSVSSNGLAIAVCWASCQTATTLTSGFRTTFNKGTVTKVADDGRTVVEVDGTPMRDVYERWSQGTIFRDVSFKDGAANVLDKCALCPLGEVSLDGSYARVMHPAILHEESGAITTFADARVGMEVTMLTAAPESLAKLISASAKTLINDSLAPRGSSLRTEAASAFEPRDVVGALMIFCGGLVMAIDNAMPVAVEHLAEAVGHHNTMGVCCFGEQGMNHDQQPIHVSAAPHSSPCAPITFHQEPKRTGRGRSVS